MTTPKKSKLPAKAATPSKIGDPTKRRITRLPLSAIPMESDYFAASGVALIPSQWTLQMALLAPMLDSLDGVVNTADLVVSLPWPLAKALAKALTIAVYQQDPTPLTKEVAEDIEANGGMAESLTGIRRGLSRR